MFKTIFPFPPDRLALARVGGDWAQLGTMTFLVLALLFLEMAPLLGRTDHQVWLWVCHIFWWDLGRQEWLRLLWEQLPVFATDSEIFYVSHRKRCSVFIWNYLHWWLLSIIGPQVPRTPASQHFWQSTQQCQHVGWWAAEGWVSWVLSGAFFKRTWL